MEKAITSFRGKYGFLSNMFSVTVEWDGRTYQNSEAAFQSAKTMDAEERNAFCSLNGVTAKRQGKKVLLRRDWEDVKDGIMEEVVRAKFTQNPVLAKELVETGDAQLMEGNNWHDTYWGVDSISLEGENHLGIILMKIRSELSQGDFLEMAETIKTEKEKAEKAESEAFEKARQEILDQLAQLSTYDFIGMEVGTKVFGRGKIIGQDGDYLLVEVRGQQKKFVLPGCFTQAFLIPDDQGIVETYKRRQTLLEQLKTLEKNSRAPENAAGAGS